MTLTRKILLLLIMILFKQILYLKELLMIVRKKSMHLNTNLSVKLNQLKKNKKFF